MATARRWFQIHLSTCIVMMLAFGVLMYLNTRVNREETRPSNMFTDLVGMEEFKFVRNRYYGWPFSVIRCFDLVDEHANSAFPNQGIHYSTLQIEDPEYSIKLFVDVAFAIFLGLFSMTAVEFLARRRERNRKL